jgi:hypothetical protein
MIFITTKAPRHQGTRLSKEPSLFKILRLFLKENLFVLLKALFFHKNLGALVSWWFKKSVPVAAMILFTSSPALAEPYIYAPETCDFTIAFPEKPFTENKCTGEKKESCAEVVTFTHTVGMDAAVRFRVTCMPGDAEELAKYTSEVMKATLSRMLQDAGLEAYDLTSSENKETKTKHASTVSVGQRDGKDVIYNGQIWIGTKSIFSLEGEISGPQNDTADKVFADILKSVQMKKADTKK